MTTIYFDYETGGVEPAHPNIQLAAVAINDRTGEELASFERKIQFDEAQADPRALEINHYDPAVWAAEAQPLEHVVRGFSTFLHAFRSIRKVSERTGNPYMVARLAGHNAAAFDAPRLQADFRRFGVFLAADYLVKDTLQLALWVFDRATHKPENFKLSTLAAFLGIDATGAHDALTDVRLCAQVARALRGPWCEHGYRGTVASIGGAGCPECEEILAARDPGPRLNPAEAKVAEAQATCRWCNSKLPADFIVRSGATFCSNACLWEMKEHYS